MSTLEVNKITPVGVGTSVTLGDSGDTFTIPSGVTFTNNGTASGFGGGKIGQVISSTYSTQATTTSSTFADTGHQATITPTATSSKILILLTYRFEASRPNNGGKDAGYGLRFLRGATTILDYDRSGTGVFYSLRDNAVAQDAREVNSITYLDSPSTTGATVYKIQHNTYSAAGCTGKYARDNDPCILTLMEVLA